ncbi:hypothetical protein [Brevundimonas sp.]|uniref:hypothetical protein n=1 Tax=Brevundimonas sp. TaxID=1871086 RepID=UPI00272FA5DD|nr:hypothetical protein [Brevundimonas sp.]MDP1912437.1 hypothetical protein [Brevundimonas sp.]
MKIAMMAAAAALLAMPAMAQQAAPAPLQVEIPEMPTAVSDPTCGGRVGLAQQAMCVVTTQAAIAGLVDVYSAAFARQQWLPAGGEENRVVYVRRREGGGCDGFEMMAFADPARVPGPAEPAWLAFAAIPGDICAAQPAGAPTPAPAQ